VESVDPDPEKSLLTDSDTLDNAVHRACGQLEAYQGQLCLIVIHSRNPRVYLQPEYVVRAISGKLVGRFTLDPSDPARPPVWLGIGPTGHGRLTRPGREKSHVSAVAVMEEIWQPWAQAAKGPLRLRVFDNRRATIRVPPDVFAGPHDTRWGVLDDGKSYGQVRGPAEGTP